MSVWCLCVCEGERESGGVCVCGVCVTWGGGCEGERVVVFVCVVFV